MIIGTHPHVLQNTETLVTKDGRRVSCLYSLGNFLLLSGVPRNHAGRDGGCGD
ncbi:MAG: CapA family protein [Clostridia bacterium]|nr:CapA family protein [Clostridia bacterium]